MHPLRQPPDISITKKTGVVYCFFLLLPPWIWVCLDRRVWPWDQADYGYYSIWLWKYFITSPLDWWDAMMLTLRLKTPGLPWLAQFATPLGDLTGNHDHVFLTIIILISGISLYFIWSSARTLFPGNQPLVFLCPLIVAASPLFLGMNQQFLVEAPQMMAVCWLIYILSRMDQWPIRRIFWHTAAATLWGCLMKVTFPVYSIIPLLSIAYHLFSVIRRNPRQWSQGKLYALDYAVMIFTVLTGFLGAFWITKNLESLWLFVQITAQAETGAIYGSAGSFLDKTGFWLNAIGKCYFTGNTIIIFVLLVIILIFLQRKNIKSRLHKRWKNHQSPASSPIFRVWMMSMASFLFALVTHSSQANEMSRFLTPILPYACFLIAGFVYFLKGRLPAYCLLALFFIQYIYIQAYSFNQYPGSKGVGEYPLRLERSDEKKKEIIKLINMTAAQPECAKRWIMVGCSVPSLSRSTLNYYLLQNQSARAQDTLILSYDFGENDLPRLLRQIKAKRPVYFITVPSASIPKNMPAGLNLISPSLLSAIESSPWYQKQAGAPSPNILIYKIRDESYLPSGNLHK